LILFVVLGLIFAAANNTIRMSANRLIAMAAGGVIGGGFIIAGFYLLDG
jgi:hypothetical protein